MKWLKEKSFYRALTFIIIGIVLIILSIEIDISQGNISRDTMFQPYTNSSLAMETRIESINTDVDEIEIDTIAAKKITVVFTDDTSFSFETKAQMEQYYFENNNGSVKLQVNKDVSFISFAKGEVESITLVIPKTFNGKLEFNGIQNNVTINSDEVVFLKEVKFNGVDNNVFVKNLNTKLSLPDLNSKLKAENLGGFIKADGVNSEVRVLNPKQDLEIDVDGLNSKVIINEGGYNANYSVKASGLNSSLNYYGENQNSTLGEQTFHKDTSSDVTIDIDTSGVNSTIVIDD